MEHGDELYYRLNADDCITEVGGAWDRFATENGGDDLVAGRIEGQSIYRHVAGTSTRVFVRTMLDGVRKLGVPRIQDYRCDSPTHKRYMVMTIHPDLGDALIITHRLVSSAPLATRVVFRALPGVGGLVRCSSCNRIRHHGEWLELEQAVSRAGGVVIGPIETAYAVCEDCYAAAGQRSLRERITHARLSVEATRRAVGLPVLGARPPGGRGAKDH